MVKIFLNAPSSSETRRVLAIKVQCKRESRGERVGGEGREERRKGGGNTQGSII
jgi:hypothetical protein